MNSNKIAFAEAINTATIQAMELEKNVFVFGIGVDKQGNIFGTTKNIKEKFGSDRIFDTPSSEQALTALAAGAANAYLRSLPYHNGKVGVIGFCSGGRQTYLVSCRLDGFDAAVDCWGGGVTATGDDLTERQPVAPADYTSDMKCPILGLFGNEDARPSPADVDATEALLKSNNKVYEFHRYDNAGHGFFAVDRPSYRQEAAVEGWSEVFKWYGKYLA